MAEKVKVQIIEIEETQETLKLVTTLEDFSAIFDLTLSKMKFDRNAKKWNEDAETYERFVANVKEFLDIDLEADPMADLEAALVGRELEVYQRSAERVSFFDGIDIDKPDNSLIGDIEKVKIIAVQVFETKARIVFEWVDGKNYAQNFNYSNWIESLEKNIPNPAKRKKQEERFKKLTGHTFEDAQTALVGKIVQVEIVENSFDKNGAGLCEMKRIKEK